ncbi:MAG: hypothetical protein NC299_05780 [Lachnospiraceae bacterium]|nr:hypothetical protein [Ruminococcus sp.]MCM1274861.1 hypothetical protein [Lachnospiraceae bacterium]
MKKSKAITLLMILSAAVTLAVAVGCMALLCFTEFNVKPTLLVIFALHIALLTRVRGHYYREYALSAPRFVFCAAVPATALSAAGVAVVEVMISAGAFGPPPKGSFDFRGLGELSFALFVLVYAVAVAAFLAAVLAIGRALEGRRRL